MHGSRNRYHIATWVGFDVGRCDVHYGTDVAEGRKAFWSTLLFTGKYFGNIPRFSVLYFLLVTLLHTKGEGTSRFILVV